jgi:hypothetical protein
MAGNDGTMAEKKKKLGTQKTRGSAKPVIKKGKPSKKAVSPRQPRPKEPCQAESDKSQSAAHQEVNGLAKVFDLLNKKISDQAENLSDCVLGKITKGRMTEMKHVIDMMERLKIERGNGELCDELLAELEKAADCGCDDSIAPANHS